jgi:hypothetical protein
MNPDDILFAPIRNEPWRVLCRAIIFHICTNRKPDRLIYSMDRERPVGALLLGELLEKYHGHGQQLFWRIDYPDRLVPEPFGFRGVINSADDDCPYATFQEEYPNGPRSIEDANLVPNTYSHSYVFSNEFIARDAIAYLTCFYP